MSSDSTSTTADPDVSDLEHYVDKQLFSGSMGTLTDHADTESSAG